MYKVSKCAYIVHIIDCFTKLCTTVEKVKSCYEFILFVSPGFTICGKNKLIYGKFCLLYNPKYEEGNILLFVSYVLPEHLYCYRLCEMIAVFKMVYSRTSPHVFQHCLVYKSSKLCDMKGLSGVDQDVP